MAAMLRFWFWSSFSSLLFLSAIVSTAAFNAREEAPIRRDGSNVGMRPGGGQQGSFQPSKLAEDPFCIDDIKKYCRNPNPTSMNDLSVLDCLQNNVPNGQEIKDECEHSLWMAKKKLSNDVRLATAVGAMCQTDLSKINECSNMDTGKNFLISCLIDHIDNVTSIQCKDFLHKMKAIVFSDYRLIFKFVESCESDIESKKCGRLDDDDAKKSIHSQGDTITCLSRELRTLNQDCRRQILRVAELQGNDYHNDRQLFLACQDDREKFCPEVKSGDGKVYRCLAARKFDQSMSNKCREKLTLRQQLQRADYKVNRGLTVACRSHIMNERCVDNLQRTPTSNLPEARLSVILLCLENATKYGHRLDPECITELVAVRKSLMEDFKLSPEIVSSCSREIRDYCHEGLEREGKTIHCLMGVARNQVRLKFQKGVSVPSLGSECQKSLGILMKEVDVRENFAIDPVLQEACGSIVRMKCSNVRSGQGKVIDCLMDLVDKPNIMTDRCRSKLMETHYFVARDFQLSPIFYKACRPILGQICEVKNENLNKLPDDEQSDVLLCLYRNRDKSGVAGECAEAVKQIMTDRAKSVDLEPAIEANCFEDLSLYCSEKTEKDKEMDCLEDNLEKLTAQCKKVVEKYVEIEDEVPELNQIFVKACEPILKDHCKEAVSNGKDAEGDSLIKCLIKHKTDSDMPVKCRIGIEHHQLITLKDFSLSHDFKEACKPEVRDHCPQVRTKHEVVSCLSAIVRNDTLLGRDQKISSGCRKQLKFELFQRSENIRLDPELERECKADLDQYCSNITPGRSAQINCLRINKDKLEGNCHRLVFKRERQEAMDPTTDFALMVKCKRMIKKYCENELTQPAALFTCLRKNKNEENFDKGCFNVIIQRQRIRATDVRLNPDLLKDCGTDIQKFCQAEYTSAKSSGTEVEGKVIGCLRVEFSRQKMSKVRSAARQLSVRKTLTDSCFEHLEDLIKESAMDYVQDIALAKACRTEIKQNCSNAINIDRNDPDRGAVTECLRDLMMKSLLARKGQTTCWKEVIRVLAEDKADIHVDPLLYRACSIDLLHVCKDVVRGEGRQMSCLVDSLNDKSVRLRPECRKALSDRVNLWNKAMEVAPVETLSEMVGSVSSSPARNYLLTVIFAIIGVIFVGGLFCGRVTKRIARQVKDR